MEGKTDYSKVIDTHNGFFGKKYFTILESGDNPKYGEIGRILIEALHCDLGYAKARVDELYDVGISYVYASNYERCELLQAFFDRSNNTGVIVSLSEV